MTDSPPPTPPAAPTSGTVDQPVTRFSRWRTRISATYQLIRANPTGRITLKIGVAVAGLAVVTLGLVLVPLPGPGWLIVLLGLSIWAIEYAWARNLLRFTRRQLQRWTRWIADQSWPVRILVGLSGLIFVSAVVWTSLRLSLGIDVVKEIGNYLAAR